MPEVELHPGVVSNPQVLGGKPVVKGTRVPVALILGQLAAGATHQQLLDDYGIAEEGVRAALGYAARIVAEEAIYVTSK